MKSKGDFDIALFTRYSSMGASSRVRLLQYKKNFEAKNVKVTLVPFFSDTQLQQSYDYGRYSLVTIFRCYLTRAIKIIQNRKKLIIIEKELFPYVPFFLENLFLKSKYIVDIDDAIHIQYQSSDNFLVRFFLGDKIKKIIANSSSVIAGSNSLVAYANLCNASRVLYVPSAVPIEKINTNLANIIEDEICICWIGSPSTSKYIEILRDFIYKASNDFNSKFLFIGAKKESFKNPLKGNIDFIPWNQKEEYDLISKCHIGIMPLPKGDFEDGKCAYKLIQYMSCGLPVLASPVGENNKVVKQGYNGFLCNHSDEWLSSLSLLLNKKTLLTMGNNSFDEYKNNFTAKDAFSKIMNELYVIREGN